MALCHKVSDTILMVLGLISRDYLKEHGTILTKKTLGGSLMKSPSVADLLIVDSLRSWVVPLRCPLS